jgi:hypothetical protein
VATGTWVLGRPETLSVDSLESAERRPELTHESRS